VAAADLDALAGEVDRARLNLRLSLMRNLRVETQPAAVPGGGAALDEPDAAAGRDNVIAEKSTVPAVRTGPYMVVPPVIWSTYFEPEDALAATPSSAREIACGCPSSASGIGVAWLPSTTPRVWSRICANTYAARASGAPVRVRRGDRRDAAMTPRSPRRGGQPL
jgi:hypothetical protein